MRQVIIVSLDGNAFQVDEAGYSALRKYLDRAAAGLRENPDTNEIMADLERAIAEKCAGRLNPGKSVVSLEDMTQILLEMGPVTEDPLETEAPEVETEAPEVESHRQDGRVRRLYKRRNGAVIAGVCSGLADHLGIDVLIVRIIFVVSAFLSGIGLGVYLIIAVVTPWDEPGVSPWRSTFNRKKPWILGGLIAVLVAGIYLTNAVQAPRSMLRIGVAEMMLIVAIAFPFVVLAVFACVAIALVRFFRSSPR